MRLLTLFLCVCLFAESGTSRVFNRASRLARYEVEKKTPTYDYDTIFVTQRIDNFGWAHDGTYQEKVLFSDKHFIPGSPILLYAGNEGRIEKYCENSGQLWDLEKELNAMVLFAEHRYYGESMPFGNESFSSRENLAYFTADQAMADYANLVKHIKATRAGAENSKVIVFGGSYGGMLASWMRMKYPNVFDGAIASSAPIWSFDWPCNSYGRVATDVYRKYGSENCVNNIRAVWEVMNNYGKTEEGKKTLASIFHTCTDTVDDVSALKMHLDDAMGTVAMVNHPYPTHFNVPLPAWPIREMCKVSGLNDADLTDGSKDEELMTAVHLAVNVYYNYTGLLECVDLTPHLSEYHGWEYQTCTEMRIPFCNDGIEDMFEPDPWNDDDWADECAEKFYGVRPNMNWTEVSYWGKKIETASNIIWSNGLLDPWSAGGVMTSLSSKQPIVIMPDAAHHLELRAAHPDDIESCILAREVETAWIKKWIGF